jgi:cholesterol oxidase
MFVIFFHAVRALFRSGATVSEQHFDFDHIIIGSGFGGSVCAHRLTEKGYTVGVLEMGKRYRQDDFPKTNWNLSKYYWAPLFKWHGILRMVVFRHVFVLSGVGVGGGSLTYASTSLVPKDKVWDDPKWSSLNDWKTVMPKYFDAAKRMLGVVQNSYLGGADKLLLDAAKDQGFGDSFYKTDVSVYFGKPGVTVADPFFGGEGPERTGCTLCGGCMVGCQHGAKNTLDKNYLYFAEKQGAQVFPETMVMDVRPIGATVDGADGYEIHSVQSTRWFGRNKRIFRAKGVVFSAGVLGTVRLLLSCKESGALPLLSDRLGQFVRTNSESIIGVRLNDKSMNMSDGVAIGSGIHIDDHTHIEAVRYPAKSDSIWGLTTAMTHGTPGFLRMLAWALNLARHPLKSLKNALPFGFAKASIILLVMQTLDGHIGMSLRRSWFNPFKKVLDTEGAKIPTYIPQANQFAEKMAARFPGIPFTSLTEIFLNIPTTAHILGGAAMGHDASTGVIDGKNLVYGYKNMMVCDGSMISANLGVNPSLTITAITEHAMSHVQPARN